MFKLNHIFGIISLPDYYDAVWKNSLHAGCSWTVFAFMNLMAASISVRYFKDSIRDKNEQCERLIDALGILFIARLSVYMKLKLKHVLRINAFFESRWSAHLSSKFLIDHFQKERKVIYILSSQVLITLGKKMHFLFLIMMILLILHLLNELDHYEDGT